MKHPNLFLLPFSFLLSLLGCSQRSTLTDGRFVVGFDADLPPFSYKEGAEYKGFDLDLARAVCEKKGWTFVARPIGWDAKDKALDSGEIDCIWSGLTMQGREDRYTWSSAYVDNSQVVLARAGSGIGTLGDLAGKTVAVQTDTPVRKALAGQDAKRPDIVRLGKTFGRLAVAPNFSQAVGELGAGKVDAVVLDVGVARRKMRDAPGKFEMLKEAVMAETYGVGFRIGNTELKDAVEEALIDLTDDGTVKILAGKYGIEETALTMWRQ